MKLGNTIDYATLHDTFREWNGAGGYRGGLVTEYVEYGTGEKYQGEFERVCFYVWDQWDEIQQIWESERLDETPSCDFEWEAMDRTVEWSDKNGPEVRNEDVFELVMYTMDMEDA